MQPSFVPCSHPAPFPVFLRTSTIVSFPSGIISCVASLITSSPVFLPSPLLYPTLHASVHVSLPKQNSDAVRKPSRPPTRPSQVITRLRRRLCAIPCAGYDRDFCRRREICPPPPFSSAPIPTPRCGSPNHDAPSRLQAVEQVLGFSAVWGALGHLPSFHPAQRSPSATPLNALGGGDRESDGGREGKAV